MRTNFLALSEGMGYAMSFHHVTTTTGGLA